MSGFYRINSLQGWQRPFDEGGCPLRKAQEPALFESLQLHRSLLPGAVIDKQPRQIEHAHSDYQHDNVVMRIVGLFAQF
jgi:hypothetical protein